MSERVLLVLAAIGVILIWMHLLLPYLSSIINISNIIPSYHSPRNDISRLNISRIEYNPYETPVSYKCDHRINSTHVVTMCWAIRNYYEVILSDGRRIDYYNLWRNYGVEEINHTLIYVTNLVHRYGYVYEVNKFIPINFTFKRLVTNQTFSYKWMPLYIGAEAIHGNIVDFSTNSVKIYIAVFTYKEVNRTFDRWLARDIITYKYFPAPKELSKAYADAISIWCTPISEILGISCSVEAVNGGKYCSYPRELVEKEGDEFDGLMNFTCSRINGLATIPIVEIPREVYLVRGEARGIYYEGRIALYGNGKTPIDDVAAVHEYGHALGLPDIYRIRDRPKWFAVIVRRSVMDRSAHITLVDAYVILSNIYWEFYKTSLREHIYRKLMSYGMDPENGTILLPITEDEDIPESLKPIYSMPLVEMLDTPPHKVNSLLLELQHRIYEIASSS